MRHPMIHQGTGSRGDIGIVLDGNLLNQLQELAESTATEAQDRVERYDGPFSPTVEIRQAGFAQGVAAALGWLAGHHADDRLTELLDIDEDQR